MKLKISAADQRQLLTLARRVIADGCLSEKSAPMEICQYPSALRMPLATFLTLNKHNTLRGCIGSLEPHRTLVEDVVHNAFATADPEQHTPQAV